MKKVIELYLLLYLLCDEKCDCPDPKILNVIMQKLIGWNNLFQATKIVRLEQSNAAASMVLNHDFKDQVVSVFELAGRVNLVGDLVDRGGKEDIPGGIVVHL